MSTSDVFYFHDFSVLFLPDSDFGILHNLSAAAKHISSCGVADVFRNGRAEIHHRLYCEHCRELSYREAFGKAE